MADNVYTKVEKVAKIDIWKAFLATKRFSYDIKFWAPGLQGYTYRKPISDLLIDHSETIILLRQLDNLLISFDLKVVIVLNS